MIATDLTGRIIEWNPAATRIYGWTAVKPTGPTPATSWHPRSRLTDDALVTACIAMGQVWSGRVNVQYRDGRRMLVDAQHSPLRDQAGQVNGVVYLSRPLTDPSDEGVAIGDSLSSFDEMDSCRT